MKNALFTNQVALVKAQKLLTSIPEHFIELFSHGTLSLELYKPDRVDLQTPHDRDEVYIIASGRGDFVLDGEQTTVGTGDFLFVEAGREHRFVDFSEDFSTWVLFYGPIGGKNGRKQNGSIS